MDFKFIVAADIHLDSPLTGLSRYEGAPVDIIRGATREAFGNLVALAVKEKVSFVLFSGDLYDGEWKDYNTGLFLARQLSRLREAGMSDGTQDQIYLALRLASLEHFIAGGTALPLLVDDALVNFDDHRARAALQLFGDLANTTQVIFFTHHQHMVALAREAIDEEILQVQELLERD